MNLIFALLLQALPISQAETIDSIYATVNDEIITTSDIKEYRRQLKSRLLYEDLLYPDNKSISIAVKNQKILVKKIIDEKILDSEAKKLGINITSDRIKKEVASKGGEARLGPLLRRKGISIKEYKKFLKKSLARREVVGHYISSKIKISDDDIMDHYVSVNKGSKASQGFQYDISHILFTFKSAKNKAAARNRADEALKLLQEKSFASVHGKYNPGESDSSFGVFKSGEMLPIIEASIRPLKTGESSSVVESPLGFHIFRLKSKKVINNPEFDRSKKRIFQFLFAKNYKEQLDYWLHQKKKAAVIKRNGSRGKKG